MRVPLTWLGDLVALPDRPGEIARNLTEAGLECELREPPEIPPGVVTGRIVSCEKHPDAERLFVCRVDVGERRPRDIVCGAPNAEADRVGAVALPGTDLGGGLVVGERKLRGVKSRGMLCSEAELGISEEASGILLLPADTPVGRPLGEVLAREGVLETYPSSNRGDLMSVTGVAREIAALSGRRFEVPSPTPPEPAGGGAGWTVLVEDPEDCPRYAGRILEGLTPGPSPAWLADRLAAAGVRPLRNLVDVTNYVLLELGHPLHAFDVDRLRGKEIGVRRSRPGEKLTTLDGKERDLGAGTLVITDARGPVATAGILGGESTGVGPDTRAVFLEGASFRPDRIRAGARNLRLVTDASARFERGVDPEGVGRALDRCVELLCEICPGARLVEALDAYPTPPAPRNVRLRTRTLRRILGVDLPAGEVRNILENLGMSIHSEDGDGWGVEVPTFRRDLQAEEDLVEEVARVHGYDRFPERVQVHAMPDPVREPRVESFWRSRSLLLSLGLTEVVTPSLVDGRREGSLVAGDGFFRTPVPLRNPLASDRDSLRGSLTPSLLEVLATNRAQSTADLAIFETGRTFGGSVGVGVTERLRAALLLSGRGLEAGRVSGDKSCDFFDMKGLVEVYVEQFWGVGARFESAGPLPLNPRRSAAVLGGGRAVGFLGEPGADIRKAFDLPADLPVLVAELDLEAREAKREAGRFFQPLPRYPGVVRDLAFVVSKNRRHEELAAALHREGGDLLAELRLFDVYEGEPLAETEKSLAFTLVFRSPDRNLTNEEVDGLVARIAKRLKKELGARIR